MRLLQDYPESQRAASERIRTSASSRRVLRRRAGATRLRWYVGSDAGCPLLTAISRAMMSIYVGCESAMRRFLPHSTSPLDSTFNAPVSCRAV